MSRNDIYVPFNYFTLQERQECLEHLTSIQDKDAHELKGEYTLDELNNTDDTLAMADQIEEMLNYYAKKYVQDTPFVLECYDEDGYYHKELNYDEDAEEHKISLCCFPGVFVRKNDLEFFNKQLLNRWNSNNGYVNYDFDKVGMSLLPKVVFKDKVMLRISVSPDTLLCDHYRDLLCDGVDVRTEYISGIVDIKRLCEELIGRGINIEFSTSNSFDISDEIWKEMGRLRKECDEGIISIDEFYEKTRNISLPEKEPVTEVDFNKLIELLIDTRMQVSSTISIPFGKYLRDTKGNHK